MARRGVTLIEIVVVLGILGLLAAFMAPFLFQVRMRAGRTQGINNLKQLGLSVHAYSDTFTRMPAIAAKGPDGRPGSILYHILPILRGDHQPHHRVWQWHSVRHGPPPRYNKKRVGNRSATSRKRDVRMGCRPNPLAVMG